MTFYEGSAQEIRGRAQSSSRNIWHEQPMRHALLEMPDHQNIRERYSDHVPPSPNIWTLNIQPFDQFRPHRGFLLARSTLPSSVALLLDTAAQVACLLRRFVDE